MTLSSYISSIYLWYAHKARDAVQEGNTKLLKSNKVSYGNSELGTLRAATARIIIDVVAYFTPDVIFQLPSTELSLATLSLDQERLAVLLYEVTLTSVELEFL